ncbi:DUF6090 family protein [Winogradskyella sp. MIT101101]|uniref:DUF6090 family protein n=1 Tax=Winogradskyella sp. MIT101101 TaxID=3098297 RepID=UPI00399ACF29
MIKFFRKIRENLLSEGKTGKYFKYAIGEIVLVVIGILIAIQINDWNENRKINKEETRFLTQLKEEFTINKEKLTKINDNNTKILEALQKVLDEMPIDVKTVDLDTLSKNLYETYYFYTFDPIESTITELENNSFKIISNKKLRSLLQSWKTVKEDFKDDENFAIEYAKDYNKYMQKHVSIDFGLKKPNTDLSFLTSIEFENWVRIRHIYYLDIVESNDLKRLYAVINEIIELSDLDT